MLSTEDLKQLLAQADNSIWRAEISEDEEYWEIRRPGVGAHYNPIAIEMTQGNAELACYAPELAAEVIRLREADHYARTTKPR